MDHISPRFTYFPAALQAEPSRATIAGAIVLGSPLVAAILFRTYDSHVAPMAWEFVRRFDLLFRLCEVLVVVLAFRAGLASSLGWARLSKFDRAAVLIWLATFWIGSAFSAAPAYALLTVSSWPLHGLFGLAVWYLALGSRVSANEATARMAKAVAAVLIGVLSVTLAHFFLAPDPATLVGGKIIWVSALPGFHGVRVFGVMMIYAALFGAGILLVSRRRATERTAVVLLAIGFGAACWSGTRAIVPAFLGALVLVPVFAKLRPDRQAWAMVASIALASFVLAALVPVPDPSFGMLSLLRDGSESGGDLSAGRMEIWRIVWAAIVERPWFGHGEGATIWLLDQNIASHVQPHNIVLQLLLHWGVLATCAAAWIAARLYQCLIAAVRQEPKLLPYALVVSAAPIAAMLDGALYYPQMILIPVAALAFGLAGRTRARQDQRDGGAAMQVPLANHRC